MKTIRIKFLIGAALVCSTMTTGAGAQPYWGDPWGEPWSEPGRGGGPWSGRAFPYNDFGPALDQMHQRQSEMRDHRATMQSLARMLSGRRPFDRAEAIGLAREIEASAGENLTRLFQSGVNWRLNPLTRARIGDNMGTFEAHAQLLKEAAAQLADELEKQAVPENTMPGRGWSPGWRSGGPGPWRSRWRSAGGVPSQSVYNAYSKLRASCNGCHADFRAAWR